MAGWTDPALKTNGVSSITKGDADGSIVQNIEFLAQRPTAKVSGSSSTSVTNSTATDVDYGGTVDLEWQTAGLSIFSASTDELEFQSPEPGVWYGGATAYFDPNTTGDRRIGLGRSVSGNDVARVRVRANEARKERLSAGTVAPWTTAGDGLQTAVFQTSGGNLDVVGDMWGLWMGNTSTASSTGALVSTVLDESNGATVWWNNWRSNAFRLYRRPSARIRKSSAQSVADNTATQVTFGTTEHDTASMAAANHIQARYTGYYLCTACVGLSSYNTAGDFVNVQFRVNGSSFGIAPTAYDVSSGTAYVVLEDIVRLTDGDVLTAYITKGTTGGTTALATGTEIHLSATLVSGDISSALVPNREFFYDGLPEVRPGGALPFLALDGDFLPRGLANLYTRDFFAHLWNPPVMSVQAETSGNSLPAGGWSPINLDVTRYDNWGIIDNHKSSGGLTLPMDGLYLVTGGLIADATDGQAVDGDRGVRIKHGSKNVSPVRMASPTSAGYSWTKTTSGLVNGNKGDVITLEGLSSAADEITVTTALMHVVWQAQKL